MARGKKCSANDYNLNCVVASVDTQALLIAEYNPAKSLISFIIWRLIWFIQVMLPDSRVWITKGDASMEDGFVSSIDKTPYIYLIL